MPTGLTAGGPAAMAAGAAAAARSSRSGRPSTPGRDSDDARQRQPSSLQTQLSSVQSDLQSRLDARLQREIRELTTRYSDAELARRVAEERMKRDFIASDPKFAGEIAPLRAEVQRLQEEIRRGSQRRATIGGNGDRSERLGE